MKYLFTALFFLGLTSFLVSAEEAPHAGPVSLSFGDVESFRDFEYQGFSETRSVKPFTRELNRYFKRVAPRYLGDHTLEIHFSDIDLAGDIQPWRNRYNRDIRYVESIYPPRAEFTYTLRDAQGNIVQEDAAKLIDLGFDFKFSLRIRHEPFFYEQEMLRSWMRQTIRPLVRGEAS